MSTTTASTTLVPPLTLESIKDAVRALEKLKDERPKEWVLFAPDGRVWKEKDPHLIARIAALEALQTNPFRYLDPL